MKGERTRLGDAISRMRAHLDGLGIAIGQSEALAIPIGIDLGNALVQTALEMATQIARHDAYSIEAARTPTNEDLVLRRMATALAEWDSGGTLPCEVYRALMAVIRERFEKTA